MTQKFVKLRTLFHSPADRTIAHLVEIYKNTPFIKTVIEDLSKGYLNIQTLMGKRILVKPNWVLHSRCESDEICLRTHDSILISLLQLIAQCNPQEIIIGDAPIQGCHWGKIVSPILLEPIESLNKKYGVPIRIKDFRRVTFNSIRNEVSRDRNPNSDYLIFDLGSSSRLEPISSINENLFRVTHYNPDTLAKFHRPGVHKYCITKELFDADVVINLPKVKTHQKTGMSCALKNLVGLNGEKAFLPHHRIGGTGFGGDSYPGKNYLLYFSELILDKANKNQGKDMYWFWTYLSESLRRLAFPSKEQTYGASWSGNDTTWRMTLDLNKIALYGKADGTINETQQRVLFSLCDGIIGGQGDGPLQPSPLPLGVIAFSNHSAAADIALTMIMGFDPECFPLLRNSKPNMSDINLELNGRKISYSDLLNISIPTIPPPGWQKYLNNNKK